MTFDTTEAALNVQEGGGGPARDLVGGRLPTGDFGGLAAIVAHHVFDGVGRQQRDVQRRGHVEAVQGDELIARLVETGQAGGVARGDETPQFGQRFAAGHGAFGQTQAPPQARRFGVIAAAEITVEIALFVHQAALDERVGPGGEHGGLERGGTVEHRQEPVAGNRRETARLQAGDQRFGDGGVFAGAGLEVQDHLVAIARQSQCHHDHGIGGQCHAVEHEAEKLRAPQIAFPQFGYLGRGGFDPMARSRALGSSLRRWPTPGCACSCPRATP